MNTLNKSIVVNFIETIWNQQKFEAVDEFIAPRYTDHSLPPALPANKEGLLQWIIETRKSFEHATLIDDMVAEDNKVMIKIRMQLKHMGIWRNIEPTHKEVSVVGYRYYKLEEGKIISHWGLIDGNSLENQLMEVSKGCKIQN